MPTWRVRSRSRSFRLRAAAIAALLVLITASILASGAPAPPIPAPAGAGANIPPGFASTPVSDPGSNPAGPPTGQAGDEGLSTTELLSDVGPGTWDLPPGLASWSGVPDDTPGMAQAGDGDADDPSLIGGATAMIGGPFGVASSASGGGFGFGGGGGGGGGVNGPGESGPGENGPGLSDCAANAGPANDCVVQQLNDLMPELPSLPPDSLADIVPTSFTDSGTPNTQDDPSARRETPVNVPEPPAWLLAALVLVTFGAIPMALPRAGVKARERQRLQ